MLYVSLEMPAEQLRRLSFALHSANPKFDRGGLDYSAIKEGRLLPNDEAHLRVVANDANDAKGHLIVWSPALTPTIQEVGSQAELLDRETPIGLVVIDHSGLMKPTSKDRDHYTRMNSVFTDAKRLALGFSRGRGVPVLMLHQLNREGFREGREGQGHQLGSLVLDERGRANLRTTSPTAGSMMNIELGAVSKSAASKTVRVRCSRTSRPR